MLEREILEPMLGSRRVDQIACEHRVQLEPSQRDAVACEQDGVGLQIVPGLPDAFILENRREHLQRGRERHARQIPQRPMAGGDVVRVVHARRKRHSHNCRAHRRRLVG